MKLSRRIGLCSSKLAIQAVLIFWLGLFGGACIYFFSTLQSDPGSLYALDKTGSDEKSAKAKGGKGKKGKGAKSDSPSPNAGDGENGVGKSGKEQGQGVEEPRNPDPLPRAGGEDIGGEPVSESGEGDAAVAEVISSESSVESGSNKLLLYLAGLLALVCAVLGVVLERTLRWKKTLAGEEPRVIDIDAEFLNRIEKQTKASIDGMSLSLKDAQDKNFEDLKEGFETLQNTYSDRLKKETSKFSKLLITCEDERKKESDEFNESLASFGADREKESAEFNKALKKLKSDQENLFKEVKRLVREDFEHTQDEFKTIRAQLIGPLDQLSGAVEGAQKEVEKYQEGYDYAVLSAFIGGVIDVIDAIKKLEKAGEQNDDLDFTKQKLKSLLKNEKVKEFSPALGDFLNAWESKAKVVDTVPADEGDTAEKIKAVNRSGYEIVLGVNDSKVIRKAEVVVVEPEKPVLAAGEAREEEGATDEVEEGSTDEEVEDAGEEEGATAEVEEGSTDEEVEDTGEEPEKTEGEGAAEEEE